MQAFDPICVCAHHESEHADRDAECYVCPCTMFNELEEGGV